MGKVNIEESDLDAGRAAGGFSISPAEPGSEGMDVYASVSPGEIALCDYSKPPDILCRRTTTIGQVSDGYHTFDELYAHRIELFIALCLNLPWRMNERTPAPAMEEYHRVRWTWRSLLHSDGSMLDGWFVMGIAKDKGIQITYHLPLSYWNRCGFAETLDRAPEFDGHTSADVLERLKKL